MTAADISKLLADASGIVLIVLLILGLAYLLGRPSLNAIAKIATGISAVVNSFLDISRKASEQIALSNVQIDLIRQQMNTSANSLTVNTTTLRELENRLAEGRALYFARFDALQADVQATPESTAQRLDPAMRSLIDDVSKLATQVGDVRTLIRARADAQDGVLSRIDQSVAGIGVAVETVRKDLVTALSVKPEPPPAPKPEPPAVAPVALVVVGTPPAADGAPVVDKPAVDPLTPVGDLRP